MMARGDERICMENESTISIVVVHTDGMGTARVECFGWQSNGDESEWRVLENRFVLCNEAAYTIERHSPTHATPLAEDEEKSEFPPHSTPCTPVPPSLSLGAVARSHERARGFKARNFPFYTRKRKTFAFQEKLTQSARILCLQRASLNTRRMWWRQRRWCKCATRRINRFSHSFYLVLEKSCRKILEKYAKWKFWLKIRETARFLIWKL